MLNQLRNLRCAFRGTHKQQTYRISSIYEIRFCPVLKKVYQKTVTFMQPKVYRAMQRTQGKMLREYFSGVLVENLSKRYGYGIPKIKQLASDYHRRLGGY